MKVKKPPADLAELVNSILSAPDIEIVDALKSFQYWRYPRGDLYVWIPVLDRFDQILADLIASYDLSKIQTNDFTPLDKEMILEILRVQKLLLENCTNRKSFASYDRLNDLLFTMDLDVLQAALFVLLRPVQQYTSQTPLDFERSHRLADRLLVLTRGWDLLASRGLDMATLASTTEDVALSPDLCNVQLTYYPVATTSAPVEERSPVKPTSSLTETPTRPRPSSHPSEKTLTPAPAKPAASTEGAVTVDLGNVGDTMTPFDYTDKIAALADENGIPLEEQFIAVNKVRLVVLMRESETRRKLITETSLSTFFLYEPEIIRQLGDVVKLDIQSMIPTAALFALDAAAHHQQKSTESMTAVCTNVNHGILITHLKSLVARLVVGIYVPSEAVDAAIGFIAFVSTSPPHGNMLIAAGILPVLIDMLRSQGDRRDSFIPRAAGLLDTLIIQNPQALTVFSNADGIPSLVTCVKNEISLFLHSPVPPPSDALNVESIIFYRTAPLRAYLRSIHRLMQASGGSDGLRNLVDSELPRSLKKIFENAHMFGPRVFASAINLMATFVHNEPTSLSILQELQLPQALCQKLETPRVPLSFEVVCAVSNAIGAICLNPAGLAYTIAHPAVLTKIIETANAPDHDDIYADRDNAQHFGATLDELVRHHPTLRPIVLQAVLTLLRKNYADGEAFVPPPEMANEYFISDSIGDTSVEIDGKRVEVLPSNTPMNNLQKVFKVLAGLLRNASLCKEFIKEGGLETVLKVADLPCIPVRFSATATAASLAQLLRHMAENDHVQLLTNVMKSVEDVMAKVGIFWKDQDTMDVNWRSLQDDLPTDQHQDRFRKLTGLSIRLTFMSEALMGLSYAPTKTSTALIKALGISRGSFMTDLGTLHRACYRQHVLLRNTVEPSAASTSAPANPSEGSEVTVPVLVTDDGVFPNSAGTTDMSIMTNAVVTDSALVAEAAAGSTTDATPAFPKFSNVKFVATRIHAVLAKFFREAAIKLIYVKRTPEPGHRHESTLLANAISDIMIEDLNGYHTHHNVERAHEGHLSTFVFIAFDRKGGLKALLSAVQRLVDGIKVASAIPEAARNQAQKMDYAHALGGFKVAIVQLFALVSPRALLESPQTATMQVREALLQYGAKFIPADLLVKVRLEILPLAKEIWDASWLLSCPIGVIKMAVRTYLIIIGGDSEKLDENAAAAFLPAVIPTVRAPIVADPARITQLVEMGFSRPASTAALVRARNNVVQAADLILNMPHMFPDVAPEPAPPASAPVAEAEAPAPAEAEAEAEAPVPENEAQPPQDAEPVVADTPMEVDTAVAEVPSEPAKDYRKELDELRKACKEGIAERAIVIMDAVSDLIFDLLPALTGNNEGIAFVLARLDEVILKDYDPKQDGLIAARLRFLAVFFRSGDNKNLDSDSVEHAFKTIMTLPLDRNPRPKWMPALLICAESIFAMWEMIVEVKVGDEELLSVIKTNNFDGAREKILPICSQIMTDKEATREEVLSALRVFVVLTRKPELAKAVYTDEGLASILDAFKTPTAKLSGCQPFLSIILRHAFEDLDTLLEIIKREMRHWLSPAKSKVTDVNHFIRQLRQAASRSPALFVKAAESECALVDPAPPQSVYHIKSKDGEKPAAAPVSVDPFQGAEKSDRHAVMDYLVGQLAASVKIALGRAVPASSAEEITNAHTYTGLLMSLLTELLGSYMTAKKAFMTAIRQHGLFGTSKSRGGLASILTELVCSVNLQQDIASRAGPNVKPASAHRLALSRWASALVVGLCADTTPTPDLKELPEDLVALRKTVLESIAKTIKDTATSGGDLSSRNGRLWALAELVYRLLLARPAITGPRQQDDSSLHIAKIMLEKNYVSLLTTAIGEVDLNFPNVREVLASLLRALEHLSKVSIKWGRTEKCVEGPAAAAADDVSTDGSTDIEMEEEDEEAPDLYRNSALGMLRGEMGDEDSDDEEDDGDEDDEMMAFEDDVMDHGIDDEEDEDTEPSSDEDDEDGSGQDWTDEDDDGEDMIEGEEMEAVMMGEDDGHEVAEIWDDDMEGDHEMGTDEEETEGEEDDFQGDEHEMDMTEDDNEYELEHHHHHLGEGEVEGVLGDNGPEVGGAWGWEQPSNGSGSGASSRNRSRLYDDDTSALFGTPPGGRLPSSSGPAQHPLVVDPASNNIPASRRLPRSLQSLNSFNDLLASIEGLVGAEAVQLLEDLVSHGRRGHDPANAIRVNVSQNEDGGIGLTIGGRSFIVPPTHHRAPPQPTPADVLHEYTPKPTLQRWHDEMAVVPGTATDHSARLAAHIINRLLPEAKKQAALEAERLKEVEQAAAAEAEKKRLEELDSAAAVALPESRRSPLPEPQAPINEDIEMGVPPEEVVPGEPVEEAAGPSVGAAPDESLARVTISIHGRDVDITDTGIDLDFLQALPDDMRADVVEQHMREQNRNRRPAPGANQPEAASQISPEFLDALPPEIRAEVILQEAMENARRTQIQPPVAPAPQPIPSTFFSALNSDLRDVLTSGQPGGGGLLDILYPPGSGARRPPAPKAEGGSKKSSREAIQLLDKPGIASLVRLLFFPDAFKKSNLYKILVNLCENSKTRADLLNLLLSVVQDGSGDLLGVDKSFQQMSLQKTLATPKATPKAKVVDSPAPASSGLFTHIQSENIPTYIAERCFEALSFICVGNSHAITYFLSEHETAVGLKKPISKKDKGKGKEKFLPQTKYPIVILMGLLDRPVLLKTPGMMDSLTGLLGQITKPLAQLKTPPATPDVPVDTEAAAAAQTEAVPVGPTVADTPAANTAPTANPALAAVPGPSTLAPTSTSSSLSKAPTIPPAVLRLVVNCLTVGECTSRTFGHTLLVMQNLSCVPDAKDIILQELQTRSADIGVVLQEELQSLAASLRDVKVDIGSLTLTEFSPASSNQAQLLRLLKTIEYLYTKKVNGEVPGKDMSESEQAVAKIYDSFDFEPMWKKLGDCLNAVEMRDGTEQIATVLLPLVEALMVVCKYAGRSQRSREDRSPSSAPSTAPNDSEDLFVSFTTRHRKVLNSIVRSNPALMSGSFSLLVLNPRVLEFDNKRNWFFQKLKRKREHGVPTNVLHLNIRRQYVFEDSFRALLGKTGDEIKYGKLSVKFVNEDGVDAGGVTREWYSVLAQQIFDPNFALFEPCAADQQTYQPNKASAISSDHLSYFKFIGRVIGKAVYDGRLLDAYFNRAFYKQILGRSVDMRDLESIDPEYHKSLQWMLENDITGIIDQEFTTEDDQFGEKTIVELKEGGAKIPVTEENKEEYVQLVVSYRLDHSIKAQIKAFLEGFYDIVPRALVQIFEPDQLELLISGIATVDVDELKNASQMTGWKAGDPEIAWFWRAIRSFSQEDRSRFLMFVTSSSRVPLGGFAQLQGSSGTQPFQIQKLYAKEGSLPQASTCFNLLLLPTYTSYEQLREKLLFAVYETGGFGKA
ncbi:E3 ubiquitin-protein ligase HUWE1, partial [Tremellales sp. Uapishka_1]